MVAIPVFVPCQGWPHLTCMNAHYNHDLTLEPPTADSASDVAFAWARCPAADPSHAYLERHRLPPMMLRQIGRYVVAPLSDLSETIVGLRLVDPSGASDAWPPKAVDAPVLLGSLRRAAEAIIVRGGLADAMAIHVALGFVSCIFHLKRMQQICATGCWRRIRG
ncbi:hypothetical protein IC608_11115 [Devosia sp. PTR5]|uniref:Uncharacterized protein n=1 Tax=Devosia oryzisoli TaxID=2774138 RepID=A0A927FV11_9HYPH|nr:hypothetical protein [Devosia oryzisoli]MBD8066022.1 hypothetical protein [Devosia oryzisoli]